MTDKLKPCPFCGGEAFEYYSGSQFEICEVVCKECGCRSKRKTEDEAIATWNNRKPMDRIVEQLEKLREEYPYKVVGEYDTYSTYNEAWSDCSDRAIAIVKGVQNE